MYQAVVNLPYSFVEWPLLSCAGCEGDWRCRFVHQGPSTTYCHDRYPHRSTVGDLWCIQGLRWTVSQASIFDSLWNKIFRNTVVEISVADEASLEVMLMHEVCSSHRQIMYSIFCIADWQSGRQSSFLLSIVLVESQESLLWRSLLWLLNCLIAGPQLDLHHHLNLRSWRWHPHEKSKAAGLSYPRWNSNTCLFYR